MTTIEVFTRNVYGNVTCYPAKLKQANAIRRLTGQKSLTLEKQRALVELGFELVQVPDPKGQMTA